MMQLDGIIARKWRTGEQLLSNFENFWSYYTIIIQQSYSTFNELNSSPERHSELSLLPSWDIFLPCLEHHLKLPWLIKAMPLTSVSMQLFLYDPSQNRRFLSEKCEGHWLELETVLVSTGIDLIFFFLHVSLYRFTSDRPCYLQL